MPSRPARVVRAVLIGVAAAVAAIVIGFIASPWPSVMVIRAIFDKGAADAAALLTNRVPDGIAVKAGLRYDAADPDALLDVYRPAKLSPAAPTVVWIHGGGFVSGRRGDIEQYLKILAGEGFAVVNVDYTIAPGATYPQPVRQVSAALRYLNANAATLGVNRENIVLAGDSAGAQIAAQVANVVTAPEYTKAVGLEAPIPSRQLTGALLFCGVYDVASLGTDKGGFIGWFLNTVTWAYSGERDWRDAEGFEFVSVANHVTPAFPATFISAGNADPLLPQSLTMDRALRAKGVAVESLFFPPTHEPPLAHEYQFNIDGSAGRLAFARTAAWLRQRAAASGSFTPPKP